MAITRQAAPTVSNPGSSASPRTISYTNNAGSNTVLVVKVEYEGAVTPGTLGATGITFNGVALTKIQNTHPAGFSGVDIWYLKAPFVGTANVVVTMTASSGTYVVSIESLDGVEQGTSFRTPAVSSGTSAASAATSVVGASATDWLTDGLSIDSDAHSPVATAIGQTADYAVATGVGLTTGCGSSRQSAFGTMSWTWTTAASFSHVVVAFIAAATPSFAPLRPIIPKLMGTKVQPRIGKATPIFEVPVTGAVFPIQVDAVLTLDSAIGRIVNRTVAVSPFTLSPAIVRVVNRNVAPALTLASAVSRVVNRNLSVTLTLQAAVSRVVNRIVGLALTLAAAVSIARILSRDVAVTLTLNASVATARILTRAVNTALTLNASVSRSVNRNVATALNLNAAVSRIVNRTKSVALTLNASVSRVVNRNVATALNFTVAVIRRVNRTVSTALTLVANAASTFVPGSGGTVYPINVAVNLSLVPSVSVRMVGAVGRALKKILARYGIY